MQQGPDEVLRPCGEVLGKWPEKMPGNLPKLEGQSARLELHLGLVYLGLQVMPNSANITSIRGLNEMNGLVARSPRSSLSTGPDAGNALPYPKIHLNQG